MPQTRGRIFDDFASLMTNAAGVANGVKREAETAVRSQVERILAGMNVVTREEFEAVRDMAALAREENDELRRRIVALKDRYDTLWQQVIDDLKRAGHMPGDAQLMRLLILGAVNWTGTWYRAGGRLSLDDVAEGAARLFLQGVR